MRLEVLYSSVFFHSYGYDGGCGPVPQGTLADVGRGLLEDVAVPVYARVRIASRTLNETSDATCMSMTACS